MTSWRDAEAEAFAGFVAQIGQHFPALRVDVEEDTVFIRGQFQLRDETSGQLVDEFLIEAQVPPTFPRDLPRVWETGGRIPRIADRHVNPGDGACCLFAPEDRARQFPDGSPLIKFFNGPVFSYFYSQSYYEMMGVWPFGERRHGFEGRLDVYFELLGTTDPDVVLRAVAYLIKRNAKGHHPCFCGSGERLRKCHVAQLREVQDQVPHRLVVNFGSQLVEYLKRQAKSNVQSMPTRSNAALASEEHGTSFR